MGDMLAAALDLAGNGWAVFPCKWAGPDAKAPKLPPPGHKLATRDPDQIRAWWSRWPNAMIGAPVPASLLVIDLDPRNNPDCHLDLVEAAGELSETLTAWSGRGDGGRHLYYRRPAGQLISSRLPAGIDLKVNGYCIVPPSIHPASGQPYRWDHREPARLSPDLRDLLRPLPPPPRGRFDTPGPRTTAGLIAAVEAAEKVNDALYWAACAAAKEGTLDQIEEDLVRAAATAAARVGKFGEGGGERGSRNTIASARRRYGGGR